MDAKDSAHKSGILESTTVLTSRVHMDPYDKIVINSRRRMSARSEFHVGCLAVSQAV